MRGEQRLQIKYMQKNPEPAVNPNVYKYKHSFAGIQQKYKRSFSYDENCLVVQY